MINSVHRLPQANHTILTLPFIPELYNDPSTVLPLVASAVQASSDSVLILFSSPAHDQLYSKLKHDPRANWSNFQVFLGNIYSALSTAQWETQKILLIVEVYFEGSNGELKSKATGTTNVIKLEGKVW